jgi:pimeloyl-ACP methyl ester carboxylesterase
MTFREEVLDMIDLSPLDQPSILGFIFYPRKDFSDPPRNAFDLSIPVDPQVAISCRFYLGDSTWPWILYFHGNGEVASDYDETAPFYHQIKVNLVVADYRGYGASGGVPTLSDLVRDSHALLSAVKEELTRRSFRQDLWVMGRSLGSISALELAYQFSDRMKGLIIESGASGVVRVFRHLGIPAHGVDLEKIDLGCQKMIKKISVPALIIHGERDNLIPVEEGKHLHKYLGSEKKELVIIPSATHNDIMFVGLRKYFEALQTFVENTSNISESG